MRISEKSRKSQVGVISVILLIMLVLVSIIILWNVVRYVVSSSAEDIEISAFIINLDIDEKSSVLGDSPDISVTRGAGKGDLIGVKFVLKNESGASDVYTNYTIINELETKKIKIDLTGLKVSNVSYVEIYPLIKTSSGKEKIGSLQDKIDISAVSGEQSPSPQPEEKRYEFYTAGDTTTAAVYETRWHGQNFTVGIVGDNEDFTITKVKMLMFKKGNPGTATVFIRNVDATGRPTGEDLSVGTTDGNTLPTALPYEWREIDMIPYTLKAGTKYVIILKVTEGTSNNYVAWRYDISGEYLGGEVLYSSNSGNAWTEFPANDNLFEIWGTKEG